MWSLGARHERGGTWVVVHANVVAEPRDGDAGGGVDAVDRRNQAKADLLYGTIDGSETDAGSSTLRKSDLSDFDIGEFV